MKAIVLFAILALAACAPKWNQLKGYTFEQYVADFDKEYSPKEYQIRKERFEKNLISIIAHNLTGASYKQGVNKFTDMSAEEIKATTMGLQKSMRHSSSSLFRNLSREVLESTIDLTAELPQSVDWRQRGVVSPVKDQGGCGSCWAFSAAEVLESFAAIAAGPGQLKTLSAQQLVSCVPNPLQCGGSGGCEGAIPELAFSYVSFYGLTSEYKYSYTSYYTGEDGDCQINPASRRQNAEVTADGFVRLPANDQQALLAAVAQLGPIAVSVDASLFSYYEEGIFSATDYSKNIDINHAVNLVGYGTDATFGDYWLVRNSWGTNWGEDGYIRIQRDRVAQCGVDSTPLDGGACAGQTRPIQVCGQVGILSDSAYPVNVQVVG